MSTKSRKRCCTCFVKKQQTTKYIHSSWELMLFILPATCSSVIEKSYLASFESRILYFADRVHSILALFHLKYFWKWINDICGAFGNCTLSWNQAINFASLLKSWVNWLRCLMRWKAGCERILRHRVHRKSAAFFWVLVIFFKRDRGRAWRKTFFYFFVYHLPYPCPSLLE